MQTRTSIENFDTNFAVYSNPYGMLMDGRNGQEETSYRYGFQGQEMDDEVKGKGNSVNYKYRMHDPRIGRFFAIDPLASEYPFFTPYAFSGNIVVHMRELEGLEPTPAQKGKWDVIKITVESAGSVSVRVVTRFVEDARYVVIRYHHKSVAEITMLDNQGVNDEDIDALRETYPTGVTVWDTDSWEYGIVDYERAIIDSRNPTVANAASEGTIMLTHKESILSRRRGTGIVGTGTNAYISTWTGNQKRFDVTAFKAKYETNSHNVSSATKDELRSRITTMTLVPEIHMNIDAHTSRVDPTDMTNLELSKLRAKGVYDAVVSIVKEMYPDVMIDGEMQPSSKFTSFMNRVSWTGHGEAEAEAAGRPENDNTPSDRRTDVTFYFTPR